MAWTPEALRQAAPVKLAVGSVLHSGGAGRLFEHALTEWGPGRWRTRLWAGVSEVCSVLEAVKVEALAVSDPRQALDGFWTALDESSLVLVLERVMAGLPVSWWAAPATRSSRIARGTRPALDGNRRWSTSTAALMGSRGLAWAYT